MIIENIYFVNNSDPGDRLPGVTRPKLAALAQAVDDARATLRPITDQLQEMRLERAAILVRIRMLKSPAAYGGHSLGDDELQVLHEQKKLDKLDVSIARAVELQQVRSDRLSAIAQLHQSCVSWISEGRPDGTIIAPCESKPVALKKSEGFAEAVENRRRRLRELAADKHRVESQLIPSAIVKSRVLDQIKRLAEAGAPDIAQALHFGGAVQFPMSRVQSSVFLENGKALAFAEVPDVLGILAWTFRKPLVDALFAEIDSEADDGNALDDDARAKALAVIAGDALSIEREEESLIEQAQAVAQEILRRPDASPAAVLGVELITPARSASSVVTSIVDRLIK